jgi:hypothetical protein
MGKGIFRSLNRVGETTTFHTNASSATTFDPVIGFWSGSDRVSWDLGDGSGYLAGNSISYTYGDNGDTKEVTLRTNQLSNLRYFNASIDSIVGHLDMSGWDRLSNFGSNNGFDVLFNSELTGITHTYSPESLRYYRANLCNLIGGHDMSMFPDLGGRLNINNNPNLTSITHTYSTNSWYQYLAYSCDITGTHDLSMFPNFGGDFRMFSNPNLTRVIHTGSTENITNYSLYNCDITGNHDVSMFPNLGANNSPGFGFLLNNNSNLTGITHTYSSRVINDYEITSCDITGNHDVSMLNIGQEFKMNSNPNLTGITHTPTGQTTEITTYQSHSCDITGVHDISKLLGLNSTDNSGGLLMYSNPNLTDILFPLSTGSFKDSSGTEQLAFNLRNSNFGYINFLPLSGVTMDVNSTYGTTINLDDNNMSVTDVNHMLVDFDYLSSTVNPSGWSGVTLDIAGTNAAPDNTSGGFDGIAAFSSLTGATNSWIITTS